MNPGVSDATTGCFFQRRAVSNVRWTTARSLASHGTTSTSGMTGAGLKKCIPTTRPGVAQEEAIAATESDEVFVARIALAETTASSALNNDCLTSIRSTTAST